MAETNITLSTNFPLVKKKNKKRKEKPTGTSQVVSWLRIHLAMQGWIPGRETKSPHAVKELSLQGAATTEPTHHN